MTFVVYFDQGLGAAHSKHWLKYVFHIFYIKKNKKEGKWAKWAKCVLGNSTQTVVNMAM